MSPGRGAEAWSRSDSVVDRLALLRASAIDIERALLAAVFLDGRRFAAVRETFTAAGLETERHRNIWQAIEDLVDAGVALDLVTVRAELERRGKLEEAGGVAYLAALLDGFSRSANVDSYGQQLQEIRARLEAVASSERVCHAATNGTTPDELAALLREEGDRLARMLPSPAAPTLSLYDASIIPTRPEFTVANLVRKVGLHLIWAKPSAGKTWTLLRWVHELMLPRESQRARLCDHPELWINRRWKRVLWIATEEDGPTLRYKADQVLRGLDVDGLEGTLLYRFAAETGHRITLDDLPAIVEADGPLDAIILDSLTGLRPKTVNGERIRWDVDNDAANEMCLRLRGLAAERGLALFLVHHTGREAAKGYRGPTDWWASADVMFGFVPDDSGRTKVVVEKNRDGKRLPEFYLTPSWENGRYELAYEGVASTLKLTPTAKAVLAWFRGSGQASQAQALGAGLGGRSTVQGAIKALVASGAIRDTGNQVAGSPIYAAVPEGAGTPSGPAAVEK